jgi:hypothetical protein
MYVGSSCRLIGQFLQISDLHLSIHHDPKRMGDLLELCVELKDIDPAVVLITGV